MQLDIRTLLVAVALATAFCAGARIVLWRTHADMPGLAQWAGAGVAAAVAIMLIVVGGVHSDPLALSMAQVMIAGGFMLAWSGFRRFLGRRPLSVAMLATVAVAVLGTIVAAQLWQALMIRSIGNALVIAVVSALIARDLLTAVRPGQIAMLSTGWFYALNALFFLLRGLAAARGVETADTFNPDGLAALPALWWLCMSVATTLGMVLMTGERLQAHLDRQANRDPLTGALNRRAFALEVRKEIGRARRHSQSLSLLMMDLDHFKQINDQLGHACGDAVLCSFVASAERILRSEDLFFRFGGEEFVAILPSTRAEQALVAADRLRAAFVSDAAAQLDSGRRLPFPITVSIGVGELHAQEEIDGLLRRTDMALYRAKTGGRNRCELAGDMAAPLTPSTDWGVAAQAE